MYQFKDPARITMAAALCLALYMALELLRGLVLLYELWTWPGFDDGVLRVSDIMALASLVLLVACIAAVGMWTYRASAMPMRSATKSRSRRAGRWAGISCRS